MDILKQIVEELERQRKLEAQRNEQVLAECQQVDDDDAWIEHDTPEALFEALGV